MVENKKDGLVSIIVPVYGVEQYLEQCLDSLINQSYRNIEIILIDDESPDKCPKICDNYAKKDKRIKVLHKKNGGAGNARNVGLANVKGEYICFVDSDDYVENRYIEILLKSVIEYNADIVVCGYKDIYMNKEIQNILDEYYSIYTNQDFLRLFLDDWRCSLIWNKIFKSSLLDNIKFVEGHIIDDEYFTYKVVSNAKNVVVINEVLYNYRIRKSSVMGQSVEKQEKIMNEKIDYLIERYQFISKKYPMLKNDYLNNLMDNFIYFLREPKDRNRIRNKITKILLNYLLKEIVLSSISIKKKLIFIFNLLNNHTNNNVSNTDIYIPFE